MTLLSIDQVFAAFRRLPSPPPLLLDLLQALQDKGTAIDELVRELGKDPALAATVLRLANSAFYGMSGRIADLHRAAVVLGTTTLESMAVAACAMQQFHKLEGLGEDWTHFWRHSFATAACARQLAADTALDKEIAFVSGLLHDIGRLVLVSCFNAEYQHVIERSSKADVSLQEAERLILGIDHALVGAALLTQWGIPALIVEAVGAHHDPMNELDSVSLAAVVAAANNLMAEPALAEAELAQGLNAARIPPWVTLRFTPERLYASVRHAAEEAQGLAAQLTDEELPPFAQLQATLDHRRRRN